MFSFLGFSCDSMIYKALYHEKDIRENEIECIIREINVLIIYLFYIYFGRSLYKEIYNNFVHISNE